MAESTPKIQSNTSVDSNWLKEYHSRITEEYRFSMERKDRVTDWAIAVFFASVVAYAELLRNASPSIWRVSLLVGLLAFMIRLFSSSCLAYAYLKKWRYLLDSIEKHWMKGDPSVRVIQNDIEKLHFSPRTTETRFYFIKSQLKAGFSLLFLFPFFMLSYELYAYPQDYLTVIIVSFLVVYLIYEVYLWIWGTKAMEKPTSTEQRTQVQ